MSNLVKQEQTRLENKVGEIEQDLKFKFPNSQVSAQDTPSFLQVGDLSMDTGKIDLQPETVDPSLIYQTLPSGERISKYPNYISGIGEEDRLAKQQTTANKWTNGLTKFLGKTGTSVLGGTVGSVYGIFESVRDGSVQALWNNDFNNYLDNLNEKMDYQLPNYYTEQEKDFGFGESLTTANFWANDFLGGLSFTVGTVVSEGLWAAATGGTSLITSAARLGLRGANKGSQIVRGISSVKDVSKAVKESTRVTKDFLKKSALDVSKATNYGKAAQIANTARFTYTSAGYEAGVEARQYQREQKRLFEENFEKVNGRPITLEDRLQFDENLQDTSNLVFASNLALVGASNLAILGKMYNINSPIKAPKGWINKKVFGVGVNKTAESIFESIKRNTAQKILGTSYSIFKAPFIEGLVEEGGQAVISTSAEAFLESQYNNQKPSIDLIEAMYEGLSDTYGTKQGWKEIGLGMLIGLVGGQASNVASGQGLFSDISNLKKQDIQEAEARNLYSAEKIVSEIAKNATINYANEQAKIAEDRGDLSGESLSNDMAMMASIMAADRFGYSKDAKDDLFTLVDLVSTETIQEQYGVESVEEAQEIKDKIKEDYQKLEDSYKRNREFSEYQIGTQNLPKDTPDINISQYKDALAYQLTMAERAEELSSDYLKGIKQEVAEFTSPQANFESALDLQDALMRSSSEKRNEYSNLKRRFNRATKALDLAEKRQRSIQNEIVSREEVGQLAKELDRNQNRITDIQLELDNTRNEMNILTESILVSSPFTDSSDFVRTFDIIDIDETLENLQREVEFLEKRNPQKATRIKKLTDEYKKSLYITENYGKIVNSLLNPKLGLRGDSRTFFSKIKPLNQVTADFLKTLGQSVEDYNKIDTVFNRTSVENTQVEDQQGDDIAEEETTEVTNEELSPVDTLRTKIQELLSTNNYLLNYYGEDLESRKPTIEDLNEYQNLKEKYGDTNIDILINVDPTRLSPTARGGLSLAEITKFQQLAKKLANWRVLDGIEENGISILDLLNQLESLQKPINQEIEIQDQTTETEDLEIALEAKQVDTQEDEDPSLSQTWDTALVKQNKNTTELTHLNLSSFVERGAVIKENGVLISNLDTIQKEIGRTFTIEINNKSIPTKVVKHNRLRFENDKFQDLLNETNIKVINLSGVKGSRWSSVYEQTEEGFKPIDTDYIIDPADSGFTKMSPEEVYNIQPGQSIYYKLPLNDRWNREFQKEIENLNLQDDKVVQKLKKKIENQVLIYNVNENNEVVGVVKAADENSTNPEFLTIRKKAAEVLFESYINGNDNSVEVLPFAVNVERVFVGMPNLTLEESSQGKLTPKKTAFNERTIKMVESFGISSAGQIVQNPNSEIDLSEVNTQFTQNLEGNRPVAIVRYKNQLIAYPISVKRRQSELYDSVVDVLSNTDLTNPQKVTQVAEQLRQNGIDPKQYNLIQTADISFIGSRDQQRLLNDLQNLQRSIKPEEFLSANYTKDNLLQDGQITINLEDKAFRNPKIKVDYSSIAPSVQPLSFEEDLFNRTGRVMESTYNNIVNKIINEENILPFEQNVITLQTQEVYRRVNEKLSMTEEKQKQSENERRKKCKK